MENTTKRIRLSANSTSPLKCTGCKKRIRSRFFLTALDGTWHERCLTCDVCNEILFSFGSGKCYCRADLKLCMMDYIRLYGKPGVCSMCSDVIHATEKVMKFKNYTYHQQCFKCSVCCVYFEKGDCVAIPTEKLILCSVHHTEYVMIHNRGYGGGYTDHISDCNVHIDQNKEYGKDIEHNDLYEDLGYEKSNTGDIYVNHYKIKFDNNMVP